MERYVIGIDVGGTSVKLGLLREDGAAVSLWRLPTRRENGAAGILSDAAASVEEACARCGVSRSDVLGVGIGVPGPVTAGCVVHRCVNLGWDVLDVAAAFEQYSGISRAVVCNDADAAALGEFWQGAGRGCGSMVMVTLGTGVGGGVILGGRLQPGAFGAAGELGHIRVDPAESRVCSCGGRGHLEQYASASGVVQTARALLAASAAPSTLRETPDLTAEAVFSAAKAGDAVALAAAERMGEALGRALATVSCVVDPELYVLGGGVAGAGALLPEIVQRHFAENAFHASRGARFALAALGGDAGVYGAARLLLEQTA